MASISEEELEAAIQRIMAAISNGIAGGEYRLRSVQFSGSIRIKGAPSIVSSFSRTIPLGESIAISEQEKTVTQGAETSDQNSMLQNGGDKISGSTTVTTDS